MNFFPIIFACLGFLGLFLLGVAAMIFALRRPRGNHDLYRP